MPRLFATRLLTRNGSVLKSGVLLFQNLFVESIRVVGIKRFVGINDEYHICFPILLGYIIHSSLCIVFRERSAKIPVFELS